jgi:plastocyanin
MSSTRTRPATAVAALALGALAIGLAGCAAATSSVAPSGTRAATGSTTAANAGATLTISGFAFSDLTVRAGAQVTVMNQDPVAHTVTVHGTSTDVTVPAGGQVTFVAPGQPGSYPLTCDFHPSMHGTLHVTA